MYRLPPRVVVRFDQRVDTCQVVEKQHRPGGEEKQPHYGRVVRVPTPSVRGASSPCGERAALP